MFRNWYVNNDIQVSELTILNDIVKMNIFGDIIGWNLKYERTRFLTSTAPSKLKTTRMLRMGLGIIYQSYAT